MVMFGRFSASGDEIVLTTNAAVQFMQAFTEGAAVPAELCRLSPRLGPLLP